MPTRFASHAPQTRQRTISFTASRPARSRRGRPATTTACALTFLAFLLPACSINHDQPPTEPPSENRPPFQNLSADEALRRLIEGNQRFVADHHLHPHDRPEWRAKLVGQQHPFAVILGCSDSRVPPELLFDQGFGDLFVIRVAGNILDNDVAGSIEYAVEHLHTRLIVVVGHEACGAVTAALKSSRQIAREPAELGVLLKSMQPAIRDVSRGQNINARIAEGVEKNVRWTTRRLSQTPAIKTHIDAGELRVIGAIYTLHSSRVDFLDASDAALQQAGP